MSKKNLTGSSNRLLNNRYFDKLRVNRLEAEAIVADNIHNNAGKFYFIVEQNIPSGYTADSYAKSIFGDNSYIVVTEYFSNQQTIYFWWLNNFIQLHIHDDNGFIDVYYKNNIVYTGNYDGRNNGSNLQNKDILYFNNNINALRMLAYFNNTNISAFELILY